MEVTDRMNKYHQKVMSEFLNGAMDVCRKEDRHTGNLIELLHAQAQMCQTMVFCFMATHMKEESVASFYGEIAKMSQEACDRLVDHSGVLLDYADQIPGGRTPALLAVVELLKELKLCKHSQTVD